jgi:hypothetical protein
MRKRLRLLLVGIALVLLGGLLTLWLAVPKHRVNWDSYATVEIGMTRDQVDAVFGVPPGDYSNGEGATLLPDDWGDGCERWVCDDWMFYIDFDERNRVREKSHSRRVQFKMSFLGKVRHWLGLGASSPKSNGSGNSPRGHIR